MLRFLNSLLLLLVTFLFSLSLHANSQITETSDKNTFNQHHQCDKYFAYDIFLAGVKIGQQERTIKWTTLNDKLSATVESSGKVEIFGIGSKYHQVTSFVYSEKHQQFLTRYFHQISTGIDARNLIVSLSEDSKKADVILNGKPKMVKNNKAPLYDIDTMGSQIRLNLLNNKSTFSLYRLSSKKIKKYMFEVVGEEKIQVEHWGTVNTIRVNEVGKYDKMVLWFSPEHDFQMVKANIDAIISPTVYLTQFNKQCTNN